MAKKIPLTFSEQLRCCKAEGISIKHSIPLQQLVCMIRNLSILDSKSLVSAIKKKKSLNHLTRRPKKGNVSTHTHPDSHRPKHYRLDSNQPELCRRHMQSLHEKSTMCTNSSGPLQLPTIPVTGHPRNPLIHKVSCTFIRHKLILIVN